MKVGLVGFSGSGKSTVFRWLTGVVPDPGKVQQGQTGMAKVPDDRLDVLASHFRPKKTTFAEMAFVDTPGLMPTERADNPRRLAVLREANGLVIVLDGFSGTPLAQQLRQFREEMLFADLEVVTNRLTKLEAQLKKPKPAKEKEADLLEHSVCQRIVQTLENGVLPRTLALKPDEEKAVRSFQLLTIKPECVLVNRGDDCFQEALPADLLTLAENAIQAPCRLEVELQELSAEDQGAFMVDLGLTASVRPQIIRAIFTAMGRITFFTVGEDECRAWAIPYAATAPEAAGAIHTDFVKGFVRAKVIAYADYLKAGSEKDARTLGLERTEGKDYVVQDGDIMHILASR